MRQAFDVAVVGGGVAGAVLALALARAKKRVLVLEKDATPALNGADLLKPAGIGVLRELGVLDEVMRLGRRRDALHVFHDGVFAAALDYKADARDDFFVLAPYAVVLRVVCEELSRLENVEYRCSSPVAELHFDGSSVRSVRLASGEDIHARFYVGADGANSFMRTQAGLVGDRRVYGQRLYFGLFSRVDSVEEMNRLYVDSRGALAYFYPVGNDGFRAVLGFSEEEGAFLTQAPTEYLRERLLCFVNASPDAVESIGPLSAFARIPVARMHAPEYGRENLALLGDAIHCVHPITGQGMNLGIEDAGALAAAILDVLNGSCSPRECIAAYRHERWLINESVVEYGHALASSMRDRSAFVKNFDAQMQA